MVGTAASKDALSVTLLIPFPEFKLETTKINKFIRNMRKEYMDRLFQLYTQRRITPNIIKSVRTLEKYNC